MSKTHQIDWSYRDCQTDDLLQAAKNVLARWQDGLIVDPATSERLEHDIDIDIGVLTGAVTQEEQRREFTLELEYTAEGPLHWHVRRDGAWHNYATLSETLVDLLPRLPESGIEVSNG